MEEECGGEVARGERIGAAVFVWVVWALCVAAAVAYVGHYGVNFPTWDEYAFLPYLTGVKPITPAWLWSSHNGHRMVLPRLAFIGLIRAGGGDFRAGMAGHVALLAGAALALILATRKVRGHSAYTDAVFPLALLHLGHASCMMWSMTVNLVLSGALSCVLLAMIVGIRRTVSLGRALAIWAILALLALTGGTGITMTPPLALWLVVVGLGHMRSNRRRGATLVVLGSLVFVMLGVYVIGLAPAGGRPEVHVAGALSGTLEFLASALGAIGMISVWPAIAVVTGLVLVGIGTAVWGWFREPEERTVSSGLLMFFFGMLLLAATVGWARAGYGRGYIVGARRFAVLSAPVLCAVYLTASRLLPRARRRFVEMSVFALACMVYAYNVRDGLDHGGVVRATKEAAVRDAWAGLSSEEIAERNYIHNNRGVLAEGIEMIRQAGYGPFAVAEEERAERLRRTYAELFAGWPTIPDAVRCTREVERTSLEGRDIVVVHAPGEVSFEVEPGTYEIAVVFGILPRAWQEAESDGAIFMVAVRDGAGAEEVLMNRRLDPLRLGGDRGFHEVSATFVVVVGGTVILRSAPGPSDRHAWSFWGDVSISAEQPG